MSLEKQLLEIKESLLESQKEKSQLEGQLKELMNTLNKEWDCKSVDEAQVLLKSLEKEIADKNTEIEAVISQVREFGWDL